MIDSHIHLSYKYYDQTFPYIFPDRDTYRITTGDRSKLIDEMKEVGIDCCIEPAIDIDSNKLILDLSHRYDGFIYPAVGNHPTRCINSKYRDFRRVRQFSKDSSIIAIGETGLDYHYERKDQHRIKQKIWFQWQIDLAHKLDLPLILHIREANDDAIKILRRNRSKLHGGVHHCFEGGIDYAKIYTEELGLCLGIGGILLMKPEISEPLCQAVSVTPMKYLLLETDGPYVRPEKPATISGKQWLKARNTSLILPEIAKRIAEIKETSVENVIKTTTMTTEKLFHLS